jgi:hypothetical protein
MRFSGIKRNTTDALFSDIVRIKANWTCERCFRNFENKKEIFDTSHFITRGNKRVRWNFDNVSALCRGCHDFFGKNPDEHSAFMMKKLGEKGYLQLQLSKTRQVSDQAIDEKMLRMGFRLILKTLKDKSKSQIFGAR